MSVLECKGLTKKFFELVALDTVDLSVQEGEILGLIGPNGSGKTTLFNCVTGFLKPDGGRILFDGEDITHLEPHKIALRGVARTFQLEHAFGEMSALDNLIMALQQFQGESMLKSILRSPSARRKEEEAKEKAVEMLKFIGITHLTNEKAKNLSFGQKKLLSIAMALMREPKILMLDEPTASVNPTLIEKIKKYIRELNESGLTIFLVEHNMSVVMDLCQRVVVLDAGKKIAEGLPKEIRNDEKVITAYFGE